MSELWYYRKSGQLFGPMTRSALSEIAAEGGLTADDEVRSGHSGWQPATTHFEISPQPTGNQESSMLDSFHDILGEAPAAPVAEAVPETAPAATPPADVYFCRIQGEQTGPYAIDDLQKLIDDGRLQKHDRYMLDGSRCWLPCSELIELDFSTAPVDTDDDEEDETEDDAEYGEVEEDDSIDDSEEELVDDEDDPIDDDDDEELIDDDDPVDEDDDEELYDDDDEDEDDDEPADDEEEFDPAAMTDDSEPDAGASTWDAQSSPNVSESSSVPYSTQSTDVAVSPPPVSAPVASRPSLYQEALQSEKESSTSSSSFSLPPAKNLLIGFVVAATIFVVVWLIPKGGGMIHGQVNIDGAPVPIGIVSIAPTGGTKGPSLSLPVVDGKFEATRDLKLDAGTYTVSVTVGSPLKMPVKELEGTPFESMNGSRFQTQVDTRTLETPSIDLEFKASDVVVPKKGARRKRRRR